MPVVPVRVPGISDEDTDLLHPKDRYASLGRLDEYESWVGRLKSERRAFLEGFPGLDEYIRGGV